MSKIAIILDELRREFIKNRWYYILPEDKTRTPEYSDINNGYCGRFARSASILLEKEGYKVKIEYVYKPYPHTFIKIENKYYDSECIYGTTDKNELPLLSLK